MNMKARGFVAGFAVLTLALVGCAPSSPIVGKWTATKSAMGITSNMTWEFKQDKTFVNSSTVDSPLFKGMSSEVTGTYELKDKSLTMTIKGIKMTGADGKEDTKTQDLLQKSLKDSNGATQTITVEFKDNTMTWSNGVSLTKAK